MLHEKQCLQLDTKEQTLPVSRIQKPLNSLESSVSISNHLVHQLQHRGSYHKSRIEQIFEATTTVGSTFSEGSTMLSRKQSPVISHSLSPITYHSPQLSVTSFESDVINATAARQQQFCATPCSAHAHRLPRLDFRSPDVITEADSTNQETNGATIEVTFGCIDDITKATEAIEAETPGTHADVPAARDLALDLAQDSSIDFSREGQQSQLSRSFLTDKTFLFYY